MRTTQKTNQPNLITKVRLFLTGIALALSLPGAHADTLTWNSVSAGGNWDTSSANWLSGGSAATWNNANPDSAIFAATGIGTVSLTTPITGNSLTFSNAGYTIADNTLTLGGTTPTITGPANATISSVLAGTAGLTKAGANTVTLSGANTYTGVNAIQNGFVSVSSIGNGGAAGGIGQATSAAGNILFGVNGVSTGIITYTGPGETTDRLLTLAGHGGFYNNGTGALIFNNPGSTAHNNSGNHNVTLGGTSTANNIFASIIANGSGTTGFTKAGSGTWTLTGTNTYTGVTTIGGGGSSAGGVNGFLNVSSIGNGGVAGNLGQASSAAGNIVLGVAGNSSGNLNYIGAGESIDRLFNLNGHGSIYNNGTGSLNFTNPGVVSETGGGSHNLNLGGSYAGVNTLACALQTSSDPLFVNSSIWALTGTSTYTGATTVNGGTLLVNGSLASGSAVTVASGAILGGSGTINGTMSVSSGGILAPGNNSIGTLTLAKNSATSLTLNGNKILCELGNVAGTCDLIAITGGSGTLVLNGANTIVLSTPLGTAPAGTYTLMTYAAKSGSGTLALDHTYPNASLTVGATSVTLTITGTGMSGSWVWQGDGTANAWDTTTSNWTNNSVAGLTTYPDGAAVTFDDTGSASPNINITPSAVSPSSITVNTSTKAYTIGGSAISGSGGLTKSGTTTLTLTGANSYTGTTTVNGGILAASQQSSISSKLVIGATGEFDLGNTTADTGSPYTLTGSGVFSLLNGTCSQNFANFGGTVALNGGTYRVNSTWDGHFDLVVNSGTVNPYNGGMQNLKVKSLSGTGGVVSLGIIANSTISLYITGDAYNKTYSGNITSASGNCTNQVFKYGTGTQTLSGANTYTGGTLLYGGTLVLGSTGAIGASGSILFGGGALRFSAANTTDYSGRFATSASQPYNLNTGGQSVTFTNALTSSGGTLTKTGNGTLILTAANTYSGTTTVSGGTLRVAASLAGPTVVQSGGTLAAGPAASLGTMTTASTLTTLAGGTNLMRINKSGATLTSDSIQGLTGVTYGGTLTVTATGDPLATGDKFTLFTAPPGTYGGAFATVNLPALPGSLTWDYSGLLVDGSITVSGVAAAPIFSPAPGGYLGTVTVSITADAGSTIYYTTDGSNPTSSGTRISGASPITGIVIPANTNVTLHAYATKSGMSDSPVASATYGTISSPVWSNPVGGSWTNGLNWSNGVVAAGSSVSADFSQLALSGTAAVTLDGPQLVGSLIFGDRNDAAGWTLGTGSGGPLTLATGTNQPIIAVTNQSVSISAVINGTNGFTKIGAGELTLSAQNIFSGAVTVNEGVLQLSPPFSYGSGFAASGDAVVIKSNATVQVNTQFGLGFTTTCDDVTINDGGMLTLMQDTYLRHLNLTGNAGINFNGREIRLSGNVVSTATDSAAPAIPALRLAGITYGVVGGTTIFTINDNTNQSPDLTIGTIDQVSTAGLLKAGAGTLHIGGACTYSGATTVSNGVLVVDGSLASGAVTVLTNAALGGYGTIAGPVAIQAGGSLSTDPSGITTLTLNSTLNLAGNVHLRINSDSSTSDLVQGMTGVTYGGTLTVTDIGSSLTYGQKFTLFTKVSGAYTNSFATRNLPTPPGTLKWDTTGLIVDGSIQLIYANEVTTPVFAPPAGAYLGSQSVTISSDTGSTIHYTTDGSDPTTSGTVISAPSPVTVLVPANTNLTLTAYATKAGNTASPVASAAYTTLSEAVWINPAGGSWPVEGNWLDNLVGSGAGVTADFSQLTLPDLTTVTLDSAVTVGNLIFGDLGNTTNWLINAGSGGSLTLAATNPPVITVSNQNTTITAVIDGTNGFAKNGAGTLTLNGVNTYSGTTRVNAGVLNLTMWAPYTSGHVGNAVVVNSNATLNVNQIFCLGYVQNSADLTLNANSTLYMGHETYINNLTMIGGSSITGPTIDLRASGNVTATPTDIAGVVLPQLALAGLAYGNVGGTTTFIVSHNTHQAADLTVGAVTQVSAAGLLKAGAGTMLLTGTNTYTSDTIVSSGALALGANGVLANSANIIVGAGAVLNVSGRSDGTLTLASGQALKGAGTVIGGVFAAAGSTVSPGSNSIAALTVSGTAALGGQTLMELNRTNILTSDRLAAASINYNGGALVITNIGPALVAGDRFTLFSGAYAGTPGSVALPALDPGLDWTNTLGTDGSIAVIATNSTTLGTNACLASLALNPPAGPLPGFATNVYSYSVTSAYTNNPVAVTASTVDTNATMTLTFNNTLSGPLTNGLASGNHSLLLNPPTNTVAVTVVSQDLSQTNTYTVAVLLEPSQTTPTLTNSVSGTNLVLSWPSDHLGYRLLTQTNNLQKGVSRNTNDWGTLPGSTAITTTNIPILKTNLNSYFRLVYP